MVKPINIILVIIHYLFAAFVLTYSCLPAYAQSQNVPYDSRMMRLSEVLGSIHYLRNLCGERSNEWRSRMEGLISVEKPNPNRRALLIARFNKGYRSFGSLYTKCTPQALSAEKRYMHEGKSLAEEINSRFAE